MIFRITPPTGREFPTCSETFRHPGLSAMLPPERGAHGLSGGGGWWRMVERFTIALVVVFLRAFHGV